MSEVKRFFTALGFDPEPYVEMIEDTDGTYVYYEDYETLRSQLAEAQKENEELKTHAYAVAKDLRKRMNEQDALWQETAQHLLERAEKAEAEKADLLKAIALHTG